MFSGSINFRPGILFTLIAISVCHGHIGSAFAQQACDAPCQERVKTGFHAAEQLEREGQHDAAAQKFAAVIAEEPLSIKSQQAAIYAGQALEAAGKHVEAVEFFNKAIAIAEARQNEPTHTKLDVINSYKREAVYQRAQTLEHMGQLAEAVQSYAAFIAEEPPSASLQHAAVRAGQLLEQLNRLPEAANAYDKAIYVADARRGDPDESKALIFGNWKREALLKKADVCRRAGQANDARQAIQRLHTEFPVSLQTVQAGVVEAQLDGQSTQAAEARVAQELQAQPLLDEAIHLSEAVVGNVNAIQQVTCSAGVDATILVKFKIKAGQGTDTFWNIWVDDPAGKNLGRWYGNGTTARGRIGTTAIVTETGATLTGGWDELQLKIRPVIDQTEFLFNGQSLGMLSHQATAASDQVGRVRLERIDNGAADGSLVEIDDLSVAPVGTPWYSESFSYPDGQLAGTAGWTGSAENEIEIVDGVLRFNGGQRKRFERSLILLENVLTTYPDTAVAMVALEKKARLLGNLGNFNDARATFLQVLDTLRPTASQSEFFLATRVRYKHFLADSILHEIKAQRQPSDEWWNQLYDLCSEIIAQDTRPYEKAQAQITVAETHTWQHQYEMSLPLAETFIGQHDPQRFPSQTSWAHFIVGISAWKLHQYEKSLTHMQWLTANLNINTPIGRELLPHAQGTIVVILQESGASEAAIANAKAYLRKIWAVIDPQ